MQVNDQLNRPLVFKNKPQRIVSLVPSQTELLIHLGLRDQLVGITKFCVHPQELRKEIPVVGGTKTIHLHKIKELRPDIIICNKEENTKEIVEQCTSIAPVWVSNIANIDDNLQMIIQLGALFEVSEKATLLVDRIRSEKMDFQDFMKGKPKKKVVYFIWKDPFMAAGNDTFIHELLQLNHFENVVTKSRYPEVHLTDLEEVDLVLLSSEPYPFKEKHVLELEQNINATVRLVDGEYFSWYGSRLQDAFLYFKSLH